MCSLVWYPAALSCCSSPPSLSGHRGPPFAWLATGSSLWLNFHFKPLWLPPLLQSTTHKNVTLIQAGQRSNRNQTLMAKPNGSEMDGGLQERLKRNIGAWLSTLSNLLTWVSKWLRATAHPSFTLSWRYVALRRDNDRRFIKQEEELNAVNISYFWRGICANNKGLSKSSQVHCEIKSL